MIVAGDAAIKIFPLGNRNGECRSGSQPSALLQDSHVAPRIPHFRRPPGYMRNSSAARAWPLLTGLATHLLPQYPGGAGIPAKVCRIVLICSDVWAALTLQRSKLIPAGAAGGKTRFDINTAIEQCFPASRVFSLVGIRMATIGLRSGPSSKPSCLRP